MSTPPSRLPANDTASALSESEALYRTLAESVPQLLWVSSPEGVAEFYNPKWTEYTGCTQEETIALGFNAFVAPEDVEAAMEAGRRAQQTGEKYEVELRLRGHDGVYRWFLSRGLPLRDANGTIVRWCGACTDIDVQKRTEERQRFLAEFGVRTRPMSDPEATLRETVQLLGKRFQADHCFYGEVTPGAERVDLRSAYVRDEFAVGVPEFTLSLFGQTLLAQLQTGATQTAEDIYSAPDKQSHLESGFVQFPIRSYLMVPIVKEGQLVSLLAACQTTPRRWTLDESDLMETVAEQTWLAMENARLYRAAQEEIAARKRHEAEIVALNERLQRAIRETHHRVKNNLQIIAAMIQIQTIEQTETIPTTEFLRLGQHVRTLAAVHDVLTQSAQESGLGRLISTEALLSKLLPMLQQTSGSYHVDYELEDTLLSTRQGASLGLVVNELVSNAIKHGRGKVRVVFKVQDEQGILQVSDDGDGFPEGFDPVLTANTGLDLIESLSRWDLGGETTYANHPDGGGQVSVRFPIVADETPLAAGSDQSS